MIIRWDRSFWENVNAFPCPQKDKPMAFRAASFGFLLGTILAAVVYIVFMTPIFVWFVSQFSQNSFLAGLVNLITFGTFGYLFYHCGKKIIEKYFRH
ncbi:MAG TPA: hypothetical protein VNG51_06415 [Ktedonobacteraceae bacterium]|nr:hypothetical protein [Ktedonobacteraceae bacterium]